MSDERRCQALKKSGDRCTRQCLKVVPRAIAVTGEWILVCRQHLDQDDLWPYWSKDKTDVLIVEVIDALQERLNQTWCGCNHPSCKRCKEDQRHKELLCNVGEDQGIYDLVGEYWEDEREALKRDKRDQELKQDGPEAMRDLSGEESE